MILSELVTHGLKRGVLHGIAGLAAASLGLKAGQVKPFRDIAEGTDTVKFQLTTDEVDPRALSDRLVDALTAEFKKAGIKARFDGVDHQFAGRKYVDTTITATFSIYPDGVNEAKHYSPTARYKSPEMEQEHKDWGKKLAQAMKKIYDINGGYAHVGCSLWPPKRYDDDPSTLEVSLPRSNFTQEELEPEIMLLGIKKAFADAGLGIKILKHKVFTESKKDVGWRACHVLELKIEPIGELADWLNEHDHLHLHHGYMARKTKR